MKKKFLMRLSILSFLLLFVLSGVSYCMDLSDFERNGFQIMSAIDSAKGGTFYYNWFNNIINSNAFIQNVNDMPFGTSNYIVITWASNDEFRLYFMDTDSTFYVTSSGQWRSNQDIIAPYTLVLNYNRNTSEVSFNRVATTWGQLASSENWYINWNVSGNNKFVMPLTNNSFTNQYNYTVYGLNYTLSTPVYNGSTNVDVGQYYRLCRGFIGNHYYTNYQLLDYKIIGNDTQEFIGNKYITYTPTSNGQVVDIYFYVEPSMNQKGYKVVTYYNNEVLYSENEYNTLLVNSGGSSGDSGSGGGSSIDLTETNNLITGIGIIIKSGDERIVDAIRSGDDAIVAAITDDSEVDSLLGEIYSSGDDINNIVSDLNFKRYDNPYQNLIFGTIQNICDSLYGSGDAYITINLHNGSQKRIYASEFYIQDSTLRFFVSSFLIFGILFVLYNYFRKSIDSISSGDAKKVIDNVEVDTNFIKM